MPTSMLEPEHTEAFGTWKGAKTPEANAAILTHLQPTIDKAIRTHVGEPNPLIVSRARRMTLDSLHGYDPTRSRLQTHLFNQLQGLKRVSRQQGSVMKVPERVSLDRYNLENAHQELVHELGRDPNDAELADRTGFSHKRMKHVRTYNPAVAEGTLEASNPEQMVFGGTGSPRSTMWHQIVYDDLSPMDKLIFEHTMGHNGKKILANHQIADKIRRSPGLVSQRKKYIQEQLNKGDELSPF